MALAGDRERPGEIAPGTSERRRVVEFPGRVGEAQAEYLFAQLQRARVQFVVVEVPQFSLAFKAQSSRSTNLDFTGSLAAARRIASRASGSGTRQART